MYRPKDWKNPYTDYFMNGKDNDILGSFDKFNKERGIIYENGANAILEVLFRLAKESPTGKFEIDSHVQTIYSLMV